MQPSWTVMLAPGPSAHQPLSRHSFAAHLLLAEMVLPASTARTPWPAPELREQVLSVMAAPPPACTAAQSSLSWIWEAVGFSARRGTITLQLERKSWTPLPVADTRAPAPWQPAPSTLKDSRKVMPGAVTTRQQVSGNCKRPLTIRTPGLVMVRFF
jgi:hypothetical protein